MDLACVRRTLFHAQTKWEDIGLALNLHPDTLNTIKIDNREVKGCFTEMLKVWLKQTDPQPMWSTLLDALRQPSVGCEDLAVRVECSFHRQEDVALETTSCTNSGEESQTAVAMATSVSEAGETQWYFAHVLYIKKNKLDTTCTPILPF